MPTFYQIREEKFFTKTTVNICYPSHFHREVELLYVLKGQIQLQIDGKEYSMKEGDLSFCYPDQVHQITCLGETKVQLFIISPDFLPLFESDFFAFCPTCPIIHKKQMSEEYHRILYYLLQQLNQDYDLRIVQSYLSVLIGIVNKSLGLISNDSDNADTLSMILYHINQHFSESISLESVGKALGISPYYISHLFSQKLHITFMSYVNQQRVELATKLLKKNNMSVTEVCYQTGFGSIRTFFRVFKSNMNMTPLQYQKSC